eukprot:Amastigsp_a841265_70.p2 type:complete len:151 gc:universal Amastigsp_a841265_70:52-504(+)
MAPRALLLVLLAGAAMAGAAANEVRTDAASRSLKDTGFGSSPRVLGVGRGLFAMLLIGALFLFLCFCFWFTARRVLVCCVTFWIYVVLVLFFVLAPKRDPGSAKDSRPADWTIGWRVLTCIILFPGCCLAMFFYLRVVAMRQTFAKSPTH